MAVLDLSNVGKQARPEVARIEVVSPYLVTPDHFQDVLDDLVDNVEPYLPTDKTSDLSGFVIHCIDANSPYAVVPKALDATIKEGAEWPEARQSTADELRPLDNNSFFFLMTDVREKRRVPAVSMQISDVVQGPSETVNFFKERYPDEEVPERLLPQEGEKALWDIVSVTADEPYRGGESTAWVYHALYKRSKELEIPRWTANINEKTFKFLHRLIGIPFVQIPGTEMAVVARGEKRKPLKFGFYDIQVPEIYSSTAARIVDLERRGTDSSRTNARVARIALLGTHSDKSTPLLEAA